MLKLKYLFENFDLARKCLELYEHDESSLDEMLSYFRISSNAIYPFFTSRERSKLCFLRLSPVEEKSLSDVAAEVKLIEWLIERGFAAMKPVQMKSGELVKSVTTEWGVYNVSCFERVRGESLEDTDGTLDIVKGYGRTLGELHALLKKYPYAAERRDHYALLEEVDKRFKDYGAPEAVKRALEMVRGELGRLSISSDSYGIIHYDFEPDNVFYDKETDTFSVIDFDDAIHCWYALDIARAIDALDDVIEAEEYAEARVRFLEGYRSVTLFTKEQEESLPLMRRLVGLQEYATILYVTSEPIAESPEWLSEVRATLNGRLRWLEEALAKNSDSLKEWEK